MGAEQQPDTHSNPLLPLPAPYGVTTKYNDVATPPPVAVNVTRPGVSALIV